MQMARIALLLVVLIESATPRPDPATREEAKEDGLVYHFFPEVCNVGYASPAEIKTSSSNSSSLDHPTSLVVNGWMSTGSGLPNYNSSTESTDIRISGGNGSFRCAPSFGVSTIRRTEGAPSMSSQGTLDEILSTQFPSSIQNTPKSLALEMWLKPEAVTSASTSVYPVLTIGKNHPNVIKTESSAQGSSDGLDSIAVCDSNSFDFQLSIIDSMWVAIYRVSEQNSTGFFDPCRTVTFGPIVWSRMAHVVVSLVNRQQIVYLNGQVASTTSYSYSLAEWSIQENGLHLLGYRQRAMIDMDQFSTPLSMSLVASTTIYQLGISTSAVTLEEAQYRLDSGLPSTLPFAYDQRLIVNEDAERVPGSHDLLWYRTGVSGPIAVAEAARLVGPLVGSIDRDVQEIITASRKERKTKTFGPLLALHAAHVYVTSLPSIGNLYLVNGNASIQLSAGTSSGESAILIPVGVEPVKDLVYIPPHNVDSENDEDDSFLSTFQFCIAEKVIFEVGLCASSGMIHIHVAAVNDPPVAHSVLQTVVREGLSHIHEASSKIPLLASDVDAHDAVQQVEITQPPAFGDLFLAVSSFRQDLLPHFTPMSDLNFSISGSDPVYVKYVWNPKAHGSRILQGTTVKDSFVFRVKDKHGQWSIEEPIEVVVISAVRGSTDTMVTVEEDSVGELKWTGNDTSGFNRQLRFYLEHIPLPDVGTLVDPETNHVVKAGTIIQSIVSFPYDMSPLVQFHPTSNFCHNKTSPLKYDTEVRFRVVALDGDAVVSASDPVTQLITVACELDVISMKVPSERIWVVESKLDRETYDSCRGAFAYLVPSNESLPLCNSSAIINGIEATSVDLQSNVVLVSVWTTMGFLSFNLYHWNLTEPVKGRPTMAYGRISFYAYPDDLSRIFSGLLYQSYFAGTDRVEVELLYGNCTLANQAILRHEVFQLSTCQVVRDSIVVEILRDENKYKSETRIVFGFPWQILFCLFVYPVLYTATVFLEGTFAGDHDDEDTVVEGSPLEPVERFIQHEDEFGMFYYEDTLDGTVRWDLPTGEDFIRKEDIDM